MSRQSLTWVVNLSVATICSCAVLLARPSPPLGPNLTYSTYLGGSGFDYAYAIAVDAAGSVYIAGQTDSIDFPATRPPIGPAGGTCGSPVNTAPCFHVFVAKLDATGSSLVYAIILGGSSEGHATGIAVDASGTAYVTGYTASTDFPAVHAFQATSAGGNCGSSSDPAPCFHAFVAKLDPTGSSLVYSTYLGGTGNDIASGIAVDTTGAAYVTGSTSSADFPVTSGALQTTFGGGTYNAFVTKLDPAGLTTVYSTYLGGASEDHGAGIAVDSSGDAYITRYTNSSNFPTRNPFQSALGGGTCGASLCFDAFVSKLNATGSALVYSTYFGGSGGDYGYGIALDQEGDTFFAGLTTSTDLPVTSGALQTAGGGTHYSSFVSKLNPDGSAPVFSTYLGGSANVTGYGIAVDSLGNSYVAGLAEVSGLSTASPLQPASGGFNDAFVAKLNAAGSALIFATYLGGSGNDVGQSVAADSSGNVYVAGGTFSADFPVTAGAFQTTFGGGAYNAFVAKITNLSLPVLSLDQTSVTFSGQGLDTTSPPKTVTLTNNGDANLELTSVTATGDFAVTDDCGTSVLPAASCSLSITSTPGDLGPRLGTVTIADNAWGSSHIVNLVGLGVPSPAVTLAPSSLTFAPQFVGTTSQAQSVTLSNTGQAVLNISSVTANGEFSQSNDCSSPLAVGASCKINVAFTPVGTGAIAGAIVVTDDAPGSPQSVPLLGTGTGPVVSLSNLTLTFPGQNCETTSPAQSVTISNTGTTALLITGIAVTGDFADASTCGSSLDAGASCTLPVTFTPRATGTRIGMLAITDNAYGSPHTVPLTGTGTAPGIVLAPASLNFPAQVVTTTSAAQTVTVTNNGTANLTFTSVGLTGANAGDFALATGTTCAAGSPVAPNANCTISVTFTPTAVGARNAAVTITDNAAGSPHSVTLLGTGTAPVVSLSSLTLTFPWQNCETTSPAQSVTISNTGTSALWISGIAVTGDFADASTCGSSLDAGASCLLPVTFTPRATGTRTGMVTITDNAAGSPHTITLSGTGTAPAVSLSATSLTFGDQGLMTTSTPQVVHVTNSGSGALAISNVVLTGDFTQTNSCSGPMAPGGECDISITFTPAAMGAMAGSLSITDDAVGSPQNISLAGTGVVEFSLGSSQGTATVVKGTNSASFSVSASTSFGFAGGINLSCSANAPATCNFSPASVAPGESSTLTMSGLSALTGNSLTFGVVGTSGSQTVSISLTVLLSDFALTASPGSATVYSGQSAVYTVSVSPSNSFNQAVSLTCSGAPVEATCSVSPSTVPLDGSATAKATITVATTARSQLLLPWRGIPGGTDILRWLACLLCGPLAMSFVKMANPAKRPKRAWLGAVLCCALCCANCGGGGGGGGGGGPTGTPAGTYTLTVSANSPTNLSHSITLTLVVN
jgi:hypothetical protein